MRKCNANIKFLQKFFKMTAVKKNVFTFIYKSLLSHYTDVARLSLWIIHIPMIHPDLFLLDVKKKIGRHKTGSQQTFYLLPFALSKPSDIFFFPDNKLLKTELSCPFTSMNHMALMSLNQTLSYLEEIVRMASGERWRQQRRAEGGGMLFFSVVLLFNHL